MFRSSCCLTAIYVNVVFEVHFFPLPFPLVLPLPLVLFAPRPRRPPSNTDRAVTIATSPLPSLSSPELLLLLLILWGRVFVGWGTFFTDGDSWLVPTCFEGVRGGSTITCDPRNPPPAADLASSLTPSPPFLGLLLVAFPLLGGNGISSSLSSSSSSSPPSLSFLFMQVTARRSLWLRIACFSCCSMRKNESIRSWVWTKTVR